MWIGLVCCAVPVSMAQGTGSALENDLRAAGQAQAQGDCHTAAREYGAAVRLLPASGELRANEGIALYCDGQTEAAIAALQRAEALKASLVAPHLFLGLAWHRLAEYANSARELEIAVRLNQADPTAHLWLGYTYASQARYGLAEVQFEEVLQADAGNMDAAYALGESALAIGSETARKLVALNPKSPWLLRLVAEQDALRSEGVSAKRTENEVAQPGSLSPSVAAAQEQQLYQQAHDAEVKAREAFQAVLGGAPDSYRAHEILADSEAARQQQDAALAEYETVLKLNPGLQGIHESMAFCLMLDQRFPEALAALRAEQTLQPRSAQVMTEIGRVQLDSGDGAGAIASLRAALSLSAPRAEAWVLLGKALLQAGDTVGAIQNLEIAVTKEANAPLPYYLLARAYRKVGNREGMTEALAAFRRLSADEAERRAMERTTQGPHAAPPLLTAEDVQDAKKLAAANP